MDSSPFDQLDRAILYHLQEDAMQPITAIADALGVADNTVRNRIEKLEAEGVIDGYTAIVNYDRIGIQHYYLFVGTVRVNERERVAESVREVPGVVEVRTLMSGTGNVHVTAAAETKLEITEIAYELADHGLVIEEEYLIWSHYDQSFAGFELDSRP